MSDKKRFAEHPLLLAMATDSLDLESFTDKFAEFRDIIATWNYLLVILLMKENNPINRRILGENLLDELGLGKSDNYHINTFTEFIKILRKNTIAEHISKPYRVVDSENLQEFKRILLAMPIHDEIYIYTFLYIIEKKYVYISTIIRDYISKKLDIEVVPHFSQHSELDVEHSNALKKMIKIDTISKAQKKLAKINAKLCFYNLFLDFC